MGTKLLTPKEAKDLLHISLSLVYQLCEERRIKAIRIGAKGKRGKILIKEEEVERFLSELSEDD
jgi:excisionase family DNA binding protein